jgi:hypothetical protein
MHEVTKAEFKAMFLKHGKASEGWGQDYWDQFFENGESGAMPYMVEQPESPEHNRMMIVTDLELRQYRLFFLTEEAEESFFGH